MSKHTTKQRYDLHAEGLYCSIEKTLVALVEAESSVALLMGVSGGLDSVVLARLVHFFKQRYGKGFRCGIAHINHGLRAEESEADAQFVEALASELDLPFHGCRREPKPRGEGLQAAARDLRYAYFASLQEAEGYTHLATAHHLNDSLEGLFLGLLRGGGLGALRGFAPQRRHILRPLHNATKAQLKTLVIQQQWPWREDATNQHTQYTRNWIRKHVVSVLAQRLPQDLGPIRRTLARLRDTEALVHKARIAAENAFLTQSPLGKRLALPPSWPSAADRAWLFASLKHHTRCSYSRFEQLCDCLLRPKHATGKQFETPSHVIYVDRQALCLVEKQGMSQPLLPSNYLLRLENQEQCFSYGPYHIQATWLQQPPPYDTLKASSLEEVYLDAYNLRAPLALSPCYSGARFSPLGLGGKRKVSDFLIDRKIPLPWKKKIFLLLSQGRIAWVAPLAMDARFAVHKHTQLTLHLRLCLS